MTHPSDTKTCFIVAPIGEADSAVRKRSDLILKRVIAPAVGRFGYTPVRADHIADPGLITDQVIQRVVAAPLVIADLTGGNPNVFYELALRHALRSRIILLATAGEPIPFDISAARAVLIRGLTSSRLNAAVAELVRALETMEDAYEIVDSPVSAALGLRRAKDCAALGTRVGEEGDPFTPPRVWTYGNRAEAYLHAASVVRNTPPARDGRQRLLLAALHGHTTKRLPAPRGTPFIAFDEAVLGCARSADWDVREIVNIASDSRLDRVVRRIETCEHADGYEIRAFCMPRALPHLSPLVVGRHHLFLGLEDSRYNRVGSMLHIEGRLSNELGASYFNTLWDDERAIVLRSNVEMQEDNIEQIRAQLRIEDAGWA